MSSLLVRVADIGPKPRPIELETDADWWQDTHELFRGPSARLIRPFRLEFEAYCLGKRLLFRGGVRGTLELGCARCADPFTYDFEAPLELLLEPFPEAEGVREPCIEVDAEDLEIGRYAGEELDFQPVLRDLLLLSWPIAPSCSETCRGLCPSCGTNLNDRTCQCGPKGGNKPFAGLGELLGQSGSKNP